MPETPEQRARLQIDAQLSVAGWAIQDIATLNISACRGIAEVETRTTAIDHLEAELDRQITRSYRLRQSVLAAAFAGNLI